MNPTPWQKIAELIDGTIRLDSAERRAILEEACGEDASLRVRLEALLQARDSARADDGSTTPPAVPATNWSEALIGTQVGQYRVVGIISSGGMGTVYEAEQETPRRLVALKMLNRDITSMDILRRFEYESQILARLSHPGIAQVYEAGRHLIGGVGAMMLPYFAMEYVENARLINDFARQAMLSTRARIELFLQVCEAVQYGHHRGIIHRDLKPGNILVDEAGQVKVIDFGVARVSEPDAELGSVHTEAGQLIGTLQYMSPEQCAGDPHEVGIRSDVYSLGVVLYEMLLEQLPYDVKDSSVLEGARRIRDVPPTPPSTVDRSLAGDLNVILLTALEKERKARYQSVDALAEDLRRHLAGDLILARPAGPITRTVKALKRRPVITVGVLSVLAFLLYVVSWSYPQSLREQARTSAALARERDRALEKVETNLFLDEMLSAPHPFKDGKDVKVVDVLDQAAARIDEALSEQPGVEASLRNTIGWSYLKLGSFGEAEEHLRSAVEIQRGVTDTDEVETLLLESRLAAVLMERDELGEAESLVRKALDGLREHLTSAHPSTLQAMVNLGKILHLRNQFDEAESILTEALEIYRTAEDEDSAHALETLSQLAATKKRKGDLVGAAAMFSEAYEKQRELHGAHHGNTLVTMGHLAMLLNDQGDYAASEALFREAIDIRRELQGEDHPATLAVMNNLTLPLSKQGKLQEAEEIQQESLRIRRESLGDEHQHTIATMVNLAITRMTLGRLAEAELLYQEALGYLRTEEGPRSHLYASACINLGILLRTRGELVEAELLLGEVIEEFEESYGEQHKFILYAKHSLAETLQAQGRFADAEEVDREVYEVRRDTLGPDYPDTSKSLDNLAVDHMGQEEMEEAEVLLAELAEFHRSALGPEHRDTLFAMNRRGALLVDLGRLEEARVLLAEASETASRTLSETDGFRGLIHTYYGECLIRLEQFEAAEEQLLLGHEILSASVAGAPGRAPWAIEGLVRLYAAWEKPDEEAAWQAELDGD